MKAEITALSAYTILSAIEPAASIGASFGCLFFMSTQSNGKLCRTLWLGSVSFGFGYALGIAVPSSQTMWVSLVGSSLGSVMLQGAHGAIKGGKDLPQWLKSLIEYVLRIRK